MMANQDLSLASSNSFGLRLSSLLVINGFVEITRHSDLIKPKAQDKH